MSATFCYTSRLVPSLHAIQTSYSSVNRIIYFLRVAVAEHSFFWLMLFVLSDLNSVWCTGSGDFCGFENICRIGIILRLIHYDLNLVQDVGFFETVRACPFSIRLPYLAFRRTIQPDWDRGSIVGWFPYTEGVRSVSHIPTTEVRLRHRSLHGENIRFYWHRYVFFSCGPVLFFCRRSRRDHGGLGFFEENWITRFSWWREWCWGTMEYEKPVF